MNPVARVTESVDDDGNVMIRNVRVWCPGCNSLHPFRVFSAYENQETWDWDGNLERPTFNPSLLCFSSVHLCEGEHDPEVCEDDDCPLSHVLGARMPDGELRWFFPVGLPEEYERIRGHNQPHTREPAVGNCHSFLHDGRWQFLGDSAHHLAGQTVDMVPLPDIWA